MKRILILAGEPSGDLHASNLIRELKKLSPDIEIFGTGGDKMEAAGAKILFHLRDLAVTGLFDVIKSLPKLKKAQSILLSKIREEKTDLIILVDYPDFNLRFAKKAHKLGVPIIYYISPQVWAWRKGRIKTIKKYIKKIFVIFKFEEELYKKAGVPVEFVGHPLLDIVPKRGQFPLGTVPTPGGETIALLPGSRNGLVKMHLPIMLGAAKLISDKLPDVRFLISKSLSVDKKMYDVGAIHELPLHFTIVEGDTYDIINASDAVIVTSGTATLETAILEKPMVIIYKLPILEYLIAKPLLVLKHIGLVNIVAGREVVPELIQFKATPKIIAKNLIDIMTDKQKYGEIKNNLLAVKNSLYPSGASQRAADAILNSAF